ncbi:Progestin and adipoQ receptor member 3 [Irineochytrium annulatum]|nr:Progestin and adipoQ receptor member 3 [Irineochytrium annulatum]
MDPAPRQTAPQQRGRGLQDALDIAVASSDSLHRHTTATTASSSASRRQTTPPRDQIPPVGEQNSAGLDDATDLKARLLALEDELRSIRIGQQQRQHQLGEATLVGSDTTEVNSAEKTTVLGGKGHADGNQREDLDWWQKGYLKFYTIDQCRQCAHPNHLPPNPDIHSYYRLDYTGHQNLISLVHFHNESFNCWSHLLTALLFVILFICTALSVPPFAALSSTDRVVVAIYCVVVVFAMISSALFHLNLSHRDAGAYRCFGCLDYAGISVTSAMISITQAYFLFTCQPGIRNGWFVVLSLLSLVGVVGPLFSGWWKDLFAKFRITIYVVAALICYGPVLHYSALYGSANMPGGIFVPGTALLLILQLVGTLIYGYRLPERWAPGKFDRGWNSHNIWHFLTAVSVIIHLIVLVDLSSVIHEWDCAVRAPMAKPFSIAVPPRAEDGFGHLTWRVPDPSFDPVASTTSSLFSIVGMLGAVCLAMRFDFASGRYDPLPSTKGWSLLKMWRFNQTLIPTDFFANLVVVYIWATLGSAVMVLFFDLSKFFSVVGGVHNVSEIAICLLLQRRWRRLTSIYPPVFTYLATLWFFNANLTWPIDAVFFKWQGLVWDFVTLVVFIRLYLAQPKKQAERDGWRRDLEMQKGKEKLFDAAEEEDTVDGREVDVGGAKRDSDLTMKNRKHGDGVALVRDTSGDDEDDEEAEREFLLKDEWTMRGKIGLCVIGALLHWLGNTISTLSLTFMAYSLFQYAYVIAYPLYGYAVFKLKPTDQIRRFNTSYGKEMTTVIAGCIVALLSVLILVQEATAVANSQAANTTSGAGMNETASVVRALVTATVQGRI